MGACPALEICLNQESDSTPKPYTDKVDLGGFRFQTSAFSKLLCELHNIMAQMDLSLILVIVKGYFTNQYLFVRERVS